MKAKSIFAVVLLTICLRGSLVTTTEQQQKQQEEEVCDTPMMMKTVLVVGATGATGKHVVQQLLDKGQNVRAVVRSKERMESLLTGNTDRLFLTEGSLLDLPDTQLKELVDGSDAVVSCLGHNMNVKGLWGQPRRLVTDSAKRLTSLMSPSSKFILMGSNGVANPNGQDDERPRGDRTVIWLLRHLIPPHADNEEAAAYVYSLGTNQVQWSVVRPSDLIDGDVSEYVLEPKPRAGLFSPSEPATRANVANCMVEMILNDKVWEEWKFKMPVLHDKVSPADAEKK